MPRKKRSHKTKQMKDRQRKRELRVNVAYRQTEQLADTSRRSFARNDAKARQREQRGDTNNRQRARRNPQYRLLEQHHDTLRRRSLRNNVTIRNAEQRNNTRRRQIARKNPAIRLKEKLKKRLSRSASVVSKSVRNIRTGKTTVFNQSKKRKCQANYDRPAKQRKYCNMPERRTSHSLTENYENYSDPGVENAQSLESFSDNLTRFNAAIRDTPTNVCSCCGGLFYKHSVQRTSIESLLLPKKDKPQLTVDFLNTVLVINRDNLICCQTCLKHIKNGNIPPLCLSNGHEFPELPDVLQKLSPLEERLVALNLPFMKMYSVGSEGQSKLKGNVINVENDLDVCAKVIPRNFNETSTVQVQLMRRLRYNRPYMYETISPSNVYQASLYLHNTELYRMHNVEVRHDWADVEPHEQIEFIVDQTNNSMDNQDTQSHNTEQTPNQEPNYGLQQQLIEDEPSEEAPESETEEERVSSQVHETLIYNECDYRVQGIRIAPGEGHDPIPMYRDAFCEEKSFPKIYAGRKKQFKPNCRITYAQRVKSECRNRDRRACRPDHVLYMFKRLYNENVRKDVNIHVRKRKRSEKIRACQAKDPAFLKTLIANDEGYAVWSNLRSSPSYWQAKAKKVLAMIRQLGNCSLFITLSAAESKWSELLQLLHQLLKQQRISEDEAMQLSAEDKANLISSDPVTCMRHFDHRMKQLMKHLLSPENGVFDGEVLTDFFQRVEFQMRGSPHSHGLYWIKNAPAYNEKDPTSAERCVNFIDKLITCKRDTSEELQDVFPYQVHKHSDSCKKGLKNKKDGCRFGIPKLPMPYTMILSPLPKDFDPDKLQEAKTNFTETQKYLVSLGRNPETNISFEDFLLELQLTYDEYILAARSACKRNEVFLKRQVNEAWINAYNKKLLMAWRANMDIQFILDSYACAKYCVGYIMKSDGGISKLFNEIKKQSRKLGLSTQEQINKLASALINGTEISSQEGSGYVLGLPNTNSSRDAIFVNTGPPDQRIRILKKKEELEMLDENSDDVCAAGMIDHYQQRPESLNDICLADFATMYEFKKTSSRNQSGTSHLMLLDNSGFLIKRQKRKILRFRNFSKTQHPEHWAREQCMLFIPFRDENAELCNLNCVEKFAENLDRINENSKLFYAYRELDDTTLQQLFQSAEIDQDHSDADSDTDSNEDDEQYHDQEFNTIKPKVEGFMPPKHCSDEEYVTLMQSLNEKQRKFVSNVLHKLKTSNEPFHYFLSGGAGTGKSHAITAIVQSGLRYFAKQRSEHPDQIPIVVSAPTGKAAFNIFGMTLHTTFHFRPNQAPGPMPDLSPGVANTLRTMLSSCKLIIIDEISMVSEKMLYHIDQRLKQIFANNLDFGGKSVIVVGHLRQLRPIRAYHVFHLHDGVENVLWKKFYLYELDTIMRQHEEHAFCKALNNMSEGCMDDDDIALIRTREINNDTQPPEDAIWLFKSNDDCAEYNRQIHNKLPGNGILVTAIDRLEGHATLDEMQFELERAKIYTVSQSDGLPYQTYLKVGAEYFISTNMDVSDGLFNGSTGTLKCIETNENNQLKRVWMSFPPCIVGEKKRKQAARRKLYDRSAGPRIEKNWVPITWYKRLLSKHSSKTQSVTRIVRKQIPLVACNGMTIHKSQGSSIQNVVVSDNGKRKLEREELYVACSRATSLQGLFINGNFTPPKPPKPNDAITIELERLRKIEFPFALNFLQDKQGELKIYFHNIGSYLPHAKDLASDQCAMAANIIILAEPWLQDCDSVHLDGYNILLRENCTTLSRNSQGMIIFCRDLRGLSVQQVYKDQFENSHCIIVTMLHEQTLLHACYKSPQYPKTKFYNKLQKLCQDHQKHAIFIGDFNDNVSGTLQQVFVSQGFQLITAQDTPTTDNNTQIDGCFSNAQTSSAWVHESYYSVHKPICCVVNYQSN